MEFTAILSLTLAGSCSPEADSLSHITATRALLPRLVHTWAQTSCGPKPRLDHTVRKKTQATFGGLTPKPSWTLVHWTPSQESGAYHSLCVSSDKLLSL